MQQPNRPWNSDPDDSEPDKTDPWFRPVWEDADDETTAAPPLSRARRAEAWSPLHLPSHSSTAHTARDIGTQLLAPLAAAQDALARLDAQAELLSPLLQTGLIARLAYAEASGLLAASGLVIHPVDLALRDTERLGRRDLLARSRRNHAADTDDNTGLAVDDHVRRALHLARLLQHLPSADDPLANPHSAQTRLGPLGPAATFDSDRFRYWRAAHWLPPRQRTEENPALLRAADTARAWMESGVTDQPDAAQGLAAAAIKLRRAGTLRWIPLLVWSGWFALCTPDDPGLLPRLRGDVAARLTPNGAPWPVVFLHLVTESARAGTRILTALRDAQAAGEALAKQQDRRSKLPDAMTLLLRHPALTAPALARQLDITPQATLRLLARLVDAGVVREVTGRHSFRAFGVPFG